MQAGIASRSGFPSDQLDDVPPARNSSARMQQVLDTLQTNGAPQSQYNRVRSLMESMPEFAEENQGRPPEAAGEAAGEEVDPVDALQRLISTCYRQEPFLLEIIEYIMQQEAATQAPQSDLKRPLIFIHTTPQLTTYVLKGIFKGTEQAITILHPMHVRRSGTDSAQRQLFVPSYAHTERWSFLQDWGSPFRERAGPNYGHLYRLFETHGRPTRQD